MQISDDFCGMEVNTPLDGAVPIDAAPLLVYPNTLLTSVSAVSTHDYTVCFLGTADGHLKKVRGSMRFFHFLLEATRKTWLGVYVSARRRRTDAVVGHASGT